MPVVTAASAGGAAGALIGPLAAGSAILLALLGAGCAPPQGGGPDAAIAAPPDAALVDGALVDVAFIDGGLGAGCRAQGGTCVPGKWANCPPGSQPTGDVHADCMPKTASRGYFCCVPAPPSSCVNEARSDCFVGQCHACWGPTGPGLSCAAGRVCCQYVCLD